MKLRYISIPLIFFLILLILFPHIFYDRFIWKYFIGPVIADATGRPAVRNGVIAYEGYTIISELVYGAFLILFIYLCYLFFEKYKIKVDLKFIIYSLPFIAYGSISRVLEDAGALPTPLSYLFITPFIYAQVGIFFFISILYGIKFKEEKNFIIAIFGINIFYAFLYFIFSLKLNPVIFAIISIIAFFIYRKMAKDYNSSIFLFGIIAMISSLATLIFFVRKIEAIILISLFLSIALTAFIFYLLKDKISFMDKISSFVIFAHLLDGITTYLAVVDPFKIGFKYGEKHPFSAFLMNYGILYPLIKTIVTFLVLYGIDDLKLNLKNTIKFFLFFLGFSPGLRDLLRVLISV
ncbi:MAG: DUF63 family protein [Thermoplasmatales archaeon]|nr:DUF63 family protein [Thermoplasmatales archaeon]